MTTALITGASSGIGAVYARRLAARGHDLVLVARATDRLNALATELRDAHGVAIEVITADLTDGASSKRSSSFFRSDPAIDILVNNAGAALISDFATADPAEMDALVRLNVLVPTLLTSAAIGGMVERGSGSIVNIASVLALLPEYSRVSMRRPSPMCCRSRRVSPPKPDRRASMCGRCCRRRTRTEIYDRLAATSARFPTSWRSRISSMRRWSVSTGKNGYDSAGP